MRLTSDEITGLEKALDMPLETIPRRLKFSVRTTEMDQTFEVRRQNTLTLWQILSTFWEKTIPLLIQMENPEIPPLAKQGMTKAFTGGARLLEQTFKFFGEEDTKKFVPDYKRLEILNQIQEAMQGDIGQMKQMLEVVESGRGNIGGGGSPGQGAPIPNQAAGRGQGALNSPRMESQVQGAKQPIGATRPIA